MQLAQLFISNKHGAKEMCYAFFPPPPVLIIQPPGLDFFLVSLGFFLLPCLSPLVKKCWPYTIFLRMIDWRLASFELTHLYHALCLQQFVQFNRPSGEREEEELAIFKSNNILWLYLIVWLLRSSLVHMHWPTRTADSILVHQSPEQILNL